MKKYQGLLLIIIGILLGLVAMFVYSRLRGANMIASFTPSKIISDNFACKEILGTEFSSLNAWDNKDFRQQAKTSIGSNQLAIKISGDNLNLLTTTSVGIGKTEGANYRIAYNTEKELMALRIGDPNDLTLDKSTDTFALDKENGLAIWTKITPKHDFGLERPLSFSFYLTCN